MSILKKLIILKNELGLALIGLLFACIAGVIVFSGASDGSMMPLAFLAIGIILFIVGLQKVIKELKTPAAEHDQYDRVASSNAPETASQIEFEASDDFAEAEEDFVFHFTGKANQSHVMEDRNGSPVYEAITEKIMMIKDRPFVFRNCRNGQEETRSVSAPVTMSMSTGAFIGQVNISSTFRIDGQDVWDLIASQGYGFSFSMNGLAAHYEVRRYNKPVGYAELGGTGLFNPKYKDNPLGKVPTNGIFKVHCKRSDVPGFFLICFAITHTDLTVK